MNIIAYLDFYKNELKKTAFEVLTLANQLKDQFNANVVAISVNANDTKTNELKDYGINNIINISSPLLEYYSSAAIAEALFQYSKTFNPDLFIFPANSHGLELAPRIAAKFNAGYIADVIDVITEGNIMTFKKPVYAGKSIVTAKINSQVKVISIRPNVFTAKKKPIDNLAVSNFTPELDESHIKAKVVDTKKNVGKLDVKEADIIVSGGRGMKSAEHFNLIEELAAVLGAATGASRAVVDDGWRPHSEQVGQTGKTVSPTLYIACGISGAIQHLAGMSTSKYIFAINKDKDAPIFKVADYGLVGDVFNILPKLIEEIKKIKG